MATVYIHSGDWYLHSKCRAYLEAHGHIITDTRPADVAIIDLDYGPPPVMDVGILVCISAWERHCHDLRVGAIFRLKPVDSEHMLDCVLRIWRTHTNV